MSKPVNLLTKLSAHELLGKIAGGDHQAFEHLYDRFSPILFGIALKICHDRNLAADILQEVFVNIWKKAHTFSSKRGNPLVWMSFLCRNKAIDFIRSRNKRRSVTVQFSDSESIENTAESNLIDPITAAERNLLREALSGAMATLPDVQRELILLAYKSGLSQREISLQLKLPLGTVKSRMRMGMQKMRENLASKWDEIE